MTWEEALDIVVGGTGHGRYRELCAEDNPDVHQRDAYRGLVVGLATGEPPAPTAPSDPKGSDPGTPEDAALRAYAAERGGCCP